LPKHAVNTSLYALLRHPWLRKVLGGPTRPTPHALCWPVRAQGGAWEELIYCVFGKNLGQIGEVQFIRQVRWFRDFNDVTTAWCALHGDRKSTRLNSSHVKISY